MTTTTNETVNTVAVIAAAQADRNTLKSTLEKGQKDLLAAILFNMGDADTFKRLNDTWKDAAKLVPQMHKDAKKAAEDAAKAKAAAKEALKADRAAGKAEQLAALEKQQAEMMKMMIEVMGLDKDAAIVACEAAMKQKRKAIETASVREQVQVNVDGKSYTLPRRGNMSQALKDLVADSGLDREAFFDKYEVKAAQAEEVAPVEGEEQAAEQA